MAESMTGVNLHFHDVALLPRTLIFILVGLFTKQSVRNEQADKKSRELTSGVAVPTRLLYRGWSPPTAIRVSAMNVTLCLMIRLPGKSRAISAALRSRSGSGWRPRMYLPQTWL
jgi:hypothetical protein